ncbi:hypothetical protein HID58_077906 [Brassica napus]|uniref:Uncharacterized protein n=1 Tax=Brassica napus TaxID=3708 RepID=A0ABQ7YSR1_BRANA|nr:hypothetical protein HID58_077906 [Brassica napus]
MTTDFRAWKVDNPAPASIMIISDEVASSKYRSSLICVDLQRSNYNCFLAYSARPFEMPVLLTSSEWLWDSLLSGLFSHLPLLILFFSSPVSETKRNILHKCSESERVVPASTGMFCCKLCYCDRKSLDAFKKHLSSKEHIQEVRILSLCFLCINRLSNHLSNNLFNSFSFYSLSNRSTECFRILNPFLTGKGNIKYPSTMTRQVGYPPKTKRMRKTDE